MDAYYCFNLDVEIAPNLPTPQLKPAEGRTWNETKKELSSEWEIDQDPEMLVYETPNRSVYYFEWAK